MTPAIMLLLTLHDLELAGKGQSNEAEAVREDLDTCWRALTDKEQELWVKLSDHLPTGKVVFK